MTGERRRGYHDMIGVIREYVGVRYRVTTLDRTTAELIRALASVAPEDEHARIDAWLARCDLVRYGGFRASADEAFAVLADARALVVTTTQAQAREAA
jgi:hypothetical protein